MNIKNIFKYIFLWILILFVLFIQAKWKPIIDSSKQIGDYSMSKSSIVTSSLFNISTLLEKYKTYQLIYKIENSSEIGKNDWLKENKTKEYIENFLSIYNEKWNIQNVIVTNIIRKDNLEDSVRSYYIKMLEDNLELSKEQINEWISVVKWYEEYINFLDNNYCKNFNLLKYEKYNKFYFKYSIYLLNNNEFNKSLCYNAYSWFNNDLSYWKTNSLTMISKIYEENHSNMDINIVLDDMRYIRDLMIEITKDEPIYLVNRNTNKKEIIENINNVYNYSTNFVKRIYKDNK